MHDMDRQSLQHGPRRRAFMSRHRLHRFCFLRAEPIACQQKALSSVGAQRPAATHVEKTNRLCCGVHRPLMLHDESEAEPIARVPLGAILHCLLHARVSAH